MTPRRQRMVMVASIVAGVSLAAWLGMQAFRENVMFFFNPTEVAAGKATNGQRFRLGGMVANGSVHKTEGTLDIRFDVTDFRNTVPVKYNGLLPDLFREGQGVVAHGRLQDGTFVADQILAKHDEKYMPKEVADALEGYTPPTPPGGGT